MSLFGSCQDCGSAAHLRYKPDVDVSEQSRPSVCDRCAERRREAATTWVRCEDCGDRLPAARAEAVDVSAPDGFYPEMIHFCPGCQA